MKNRYVLLGALLAMLALFAGCVIQPPAGEDDLATLEVDESLTPATGDELGFQYAYMKTFLIEHTGGVADRGVRTLLPVPESGGARATWPSDTAVRLFAQTTGSLANYPEPGVTTAYVLAAAPSVGADVYLVTVTATFPATNIMDTYVESYYVKDQSPGAATADGYWSKDDPVVDGTGAADPAAREQMEIHFRDGSIRYETIVEFILPEVSGTGFAAFDINGPLTFPEFSYPAEDPDAVFSSIIVYQQTRPTSHSFSFWSGVENQALVGVRYYTEHFVDGDTQYKGTTVAYEKAISTLVTGGGSFVGVLSTVFLGSEHAVLAENVFRKEVLFNVTGGNVVPIAVGQNSIMRSHVVNITSQEDFQLQILNDDVTRLLAWDGETYAIPEGVADEIVSTNAAAEVLHRVDITNPDGSAISTVIAGSGDLSLLYRAIQQGAVTTSVVGGAGGDIAGSLDPAGEVYGFDGNKGTRIDDSTPIATTTGTVEAWVYINSQTNWGGIVHKGEQLDWLDESWSLQFVSDRGDVAMAIARQGPYNWIMAQATVRLNIKKWYYLVGTWNSTEVKLYINGALNKTVTNTLGAAAAANTDGPIVIGSQLLEGSSIPGWYGFNGKINGVKVSSTVKDQNTISTFYNANKALTSNW